MPGDEQKTVCSHAADELIPYHPLSKHNRSCILDLCVALMPDSSLCIGLALATPIHVDRQVKPQLHQLSLCIPLFPLPCKTALLPPIYKAKAM